MASEAVTGIGDAAKEGVLAIKEGVATVFGPAAHEFGEYLADKVRFHRYRALEKILAKAAALVGQSRKPPPFKFLVPFFEQASLEEDDDDVIIEIWAKLLADASKEFSSRHMIFLRLVREITSQEAQLLNDICYRYRGNPEGRALWGVGDAFGYLTDSTIYKFLVEWINHLPSDAQRPFAVRLIEEFEVPGILISAVHYNKGRRGVWPYDYADDDETADSLSPLQRAYPQISFDILRGLNIIQEGVIDEVWYNDFVVSVYYYVLTPLGVEFFTLCNGGNRVKPMQGNFWSPETGWQWR